MSRTVNRGRGRSRRHRNCERYLCKAKKHRLLERLFLRDKEQALMEALPVPTESLPPPTEPPRAGQPTMNLLEWPSR